MASVEPLCRAKIERKGRSQEELDKQVAELAHGRALEKVLPP